MKTFTTLPQLIHWLRDTHYLFAGVPWQDEWMDIVSRIKTAPAVVGAIYETWMDIPCYGDLKTYMYIEKYSDDEPWRVYESTSYESMVNIAERVRG